MMNMMGEDKSKMATLILGSGEKKKESKEEKDGGGYDGKMLAKEVISAVKQDEPEKLYKAFKALLQYCKNEDY